VGSAGNVVQFSGSSGSTLTAFLEDFLHISNIFYLPSREILHEDALLFVFSNRQVYALVRKEVEHVLVVNL
jgi:hypothetical protein